MLVEIIIVVVFFLLGMAARGKKSEPCSCMEISGKQCEARIWKNTICGKPAKFRIMGFDSPEFYCASHKSEEQRNADEFPNAMFGVKDPLVGRDQFQKQLLMHINGSYFEYGMTSGVDLYVAPIIKRTPELVMMWVEEVFNSPRTTVYELCGILRTMLHIDYELTGERGVNMAKSALDHRDIEVRECGVQCIENWNIPEHAKYLENVVFEEQWLTDYLNEVIKHIGDK